MADASILSTLEKHKQRFDALENELAAVKAQLAARPDPRPAPAPKKTPVRRPASPPAPKPAAARTPDPPAAPVSKKKDFYDDF